MPFVCIDVEDSEMALNSLPARKTSAEESLVTLANRGNKAEE